MLLSQMGVRAAWCVEEACVTQLSSARPWNLTVHLSWRGEEPAPTFPRSAVQVLHTAQASQMHLHKCSPKHPYDSI